VPIPQVPMTHRQQQGAARAVVDSAAAARAVVVDFPAAAEISRKAPPMLLAVPVEAERAQPRASADSNRWT
jgi:hypothetical protein